MQFDQLLTTLKTYEKNSYLYEGLSVPEKNSVLLWENAGILIKEAALTTDQIQQLFQAVEQGATAAGGNRTMLGKGKDAAEAVNKAWEDLKTKVQNSGPIKNVDAAYDSAVSKIEAGLGGPDNAVNKVIQSYRKFAKDHPIAQGFIYAALIAAAGISGAGLGGAAVLGLLKMADKLLQGEKFSSAAYQGAKTGALAYGASKLGDYIKGKSQDTPSAPGAPQDADVPRTSRLINKPEDFGGPPPNANTFADIAKDPNLNPIQQRFAADLAAGKNVQDADEYIRRSLETAAKKAQLMGQTADGSANLAQREFMSLQRLQNAMLDRSASASGNAISGAASSAVDAGASAVDRAAAAASSIGTTEIPKGANLNPDYLKRIAAGETGRFMVNKDEAQAALDWQEKNGGQYVKSGQTAVDSASRQGYNKDYLEKAADPNRTGRFLISPEEAQKLLGQMKESLTVGKLKESEIFWLFSRVEDTLLTEGVLDVIKGAAGKAKDWVATKGKNLTTKITADKLMSAWKQAGSPLESEEIAKILQNAGVDPSIITKSFSDMGLPEPSAQPKVNNEILKQIQKEFEKLDKKAQQEILDYLQSSGTA